MKKLLQVGILFAAAGAGYLAGRGSAARQEGGQSMAAATALATSRTTADNPTKARDTRPGTGRGPEQERNRVSGAFAGISAIKDPIQRQAAWAGFVAGLDARSVIEADQDVVRWYEEGGSVTDEHQILNFRKGQLLGAQAFEGRLPESPDGAMGKNDHSMMRGWASVAPEQAKGWIDALPEGRLKDSMIVSWYHGAVSADPSAANTFFAELPEHARSSAVEPLIDAVHREGGIEGLLKWFATTAGDESTGIPLGAAFNKVAWRLGQFSGEDPDAVEAALLDPVNLPHVTEGIFNCAVRNLNVDRPGRAIEMAERLRQANPELDDRAVRGMVSTAVRASTRTTINHMAEWLTGQGDHPLHDMAARYLVEYAAPLDPDAANAWAGQIADPALRAEAERYAIPQLPMSR